MKIRNGFVSNSSSSSFIVFTKSNTLDEDTIAKFLGYCSRERYSWEDRDHLKITLPLAIGNRNYDGHFEEYTTFEDRLNYVTEQLLYYGYSNGFISNTYQEMMQTLYDCFKDILKGRSEFNYIYIDFDYNLAYHDGCIDHGSSYPSSSEVANEIFINKKAMANFLFGKDSKIEDGNDYYTGPDEEDCPQEYAESYKYMKRNLKWFEKNLFLSKEEKRELKEKELHRMETDKLLLDTRIKILKEAIKKKD